MRASVSDVALLLRGSCGAGGAALLALGLWASGCGNKGAAPEKDPAQQSSAGAAVNAAPSNPPTVNAAPRPPPTLLAEELKPEGAHPERMFAIDGALLVVEGPRVGRIDGDKIEWVGSIPKKSAVFGDNIIASVNGRWPDGIDVLYTTSIGRAPEPTYMPLTGKGTPVMLGPGGSPAQMTGLANAGDNTFLAAWSFSGGHQIWTVRGPKTTRTMTPPEKAGCTTKEIPVHDFSSRDPAIRPSALGGTPAGTLISVGKLCGERGLAAEVWDAAGASRIVDLSKLVKSAEYGSALLPGKGDELWLFPSGEKVVLHYKDGNFAAMPELPGPIHNAFVTADNELYASDRWALYRYDAGAGAWATAGRFPLPNNYSRIAVEKGGAIWASTYEAVYKLREGRDREPTDDCKTPFVYLYDVSYDNAKDFTFPTTQKALSSFAQVGEIGLVDFHGEGRRRLGITVTSKAQGEAVIAHVKANMKDEDPKLVCYEPKEPRKITVKKGS